MHFPQLFIKTGKYVFRISAHSMCHLRVVLKIPHKLKMILSCSRWTSLLSIYACMGQSRCFRPTVSGVLSPLKERTFIIGPRANRHERFSVNRTGFRLYSSDDQAPSQNNSVSRIVYEDDPKIHVKLFTKEGCTLCDKVKEVRCKFVPITGLR